MMPNHAPSALRSAERRRRSASPLNPFCRRPPQPVLHQTYAGAGAFPKPLCRVGKWIEFRLRSGDSDDETSVRRLLQNSFGSRVSMRSAIEGPRNLTASAAAISKEASSRTRAENAIAEEWGFIVAPTFSKIGARQVSQGGVRSRAGRQALRLAKRR